VLRGERRAVTDTGVQTVAPAGDDAALPFEVAALDVRGRAIQMGPALDAILAGRDADEWVERFGRADLPASRIATFADLARDPQVWANDYLLRTHCDAAGEEVVVRGLPVTLGTTPGAVESLGPELGQDTELILADLLGYDWDEIGELRDKGAIP